MGLAQFILHVHGLKVYLFTEAKDIFFIYIFKCIGSLKVSLKLIRLDEFSDLFLISQPHLVHYVFMLFGWQCQSEAIVLRVIYPPQQQQQMLDVTGSNFYSSQFL